MKDLPLMGAPDYRFLQLRGRERPTTGFCNCAEEYISPRTKALHRAYFVSMNQVPVYRLTLFYSNK